MILTTLWENLESILALLTIIVSAYIFFNDPIRRWRFFGYRPTALIVLLDPVISAVIFVKNDGNWSFCQGGLYDSDVYDTVEDVLERELNLAPKDYRLFYTKEVGKADLSKNWQKNNVIFGGIKLWKKTRGKAYIACFVMVDTKKIGEFHLGYGINQIEIVTINEAAKFIKENVVNTSKQPVMLRAIDESDNAIELWKSTNS